MVKNLKEEKIKMNPIKTQNPHQTPVNYALYARRQYTCQCCVS